MWEAITKPFAWLMRYFYNLTGGSYGLSIILFALVVNVVLTPFMAKSKKSMMKTSRLQPKIQELQKRHAGNQQALNQEMQELYREEGVKPLGGCVWSLIPFPILIALYSVIRQPLSRMMFVGEGVVDALKEFFVNSGWYVIPAKADAYFEIKLVDIMKDHMPEVVSHLQSLGLSTKELIPMDFHFLGLNLGTQPSFKGLDGSWATIGLFLIPFISAGMSWLSMKVTNLANPNTADPQSQATMNSMNIMMPLMSVWICFVMPGALGIYWIANSVLGMGRDFVLTKIYKKKLDAEDAVRNAERAARELEVETRKAQNAPGNTESKKKIQARESQQRAERKAALEKAERAARRERLGIADAEKPASQVGDRRYARGRAYVPDRFTNPETAEELTAEAAAESEFGESIDYSVSEEAIALEETAEETIEEAVVETAEEVLPEDDSNN